MTLLSEEELKSLIEHPKTSCISIYMPAHKAGPPIRQDPIRFKNLLKEAEERLVEAGIRHTDALEFLKPAQELDTPDFWRHQDQGLVVFIAPDFFGYYRLPCDFDELVVVTDHFHIKPLFPLLIEDGRFYILNLSQEGIKLFEATRYSIEEIELEDLPQTMDEALLYNETAKDGQFRIATSKGGTSNPFQQPGAFHGQGSPDQDEPQQDILQYFHLVDDAVHKHLRNQRKKAPLVLAGVEYLLPLYRMTNSYPHLMEEGITGSQKLTEPEALRDEVWKIVAPYFEQSRQEAVQSYHELAATGQASNKLEEIVPASYYKQVDALFVAVDREQWGLFDPNTNTVYRHENKETGDDDLLDFAAIHTWLNGGTVYAVEPEKLPDQAPIAAVLRYQADLNSSSS